MASFTVSLASLAGRAGRGVRVAVVDSGVHAAHPHVGGIAGGVALDGAGAQTDSDVVDRIGHGTAVSAAIREKAPEVTLLAVKVFDQTLTATNRALVAGIRWAADQRVHLINLSLGTSNPEHRGELEAAVSHAVGLGSLIVTAGPVDDVIWLPGAIAGVVAVNLDWARSREECEVLIEPDGAVRLRASGYPRPIPGVPPERNLKGHSFAVANATGFLALLIEGTTINSVTDLATLIRAR